MTDEKWNPYEVTLNIMESFEETKDIERFVKLTKNLSTSYHGQHTEQNIRCAILKNQKSRVSIGLMQFTEKLQQLQDQQSAKQLIENYEKEILKEIQLPQFPIHTVFERNFSHLTNQCAYMFLYFSFHAATLIKKMQMLKDIKNLASPEQLQVCSIGGCPGTELFCLAEVFRCPIQGTVLEFYPEWQQMFEAVRQASPSLRQYIGDVKYHRFNYFAQITDEIREEISKADLVTMVKFLSIVFDPYPDGFYREQLKSIIKSMKEGAALIVMDNNHGVFLKEFISTTTSLDKFLELEYKGDFKDSYFNWIYSLNNEYGFGQGGYGTQMKHTVHISIWEKKSTSDTPGLKEDDSQPMEN